jgi:hypothetical protein
MLPGTSDRKFEEQCYNPECDLMFSERWRFRLLSSG